MIESEIYKNDDECMKDEIFTFFLAGMKTIQLSTCNLIYYLTIHPEIKAKLLKEILPPVEAAAKNIVEDLDYDTVNDFEYLRMCYNESLRIEPPAGNSSHITFDEDVRIGARDGHKGYLFPKGEWFMLNVNAIHHDPAEWPEPEKYIPARFDT